MSTGERLAGFRTRDRDAHPTVSAHVFGALFVLLFLAILPGPGPQAQAADGEGLPRGTARATSGMGMHAEPTPVDGASVTTGMLQSKLEDLDSEIDSLPPPEESPLVTEAHRWSREARQRELRAEILMLDQDLLSHVVREALLKARRDKSLRDLALLRAQQAQLVDQIQTRRHQEAQQARADADEAQRDATGQHPLLQDLAQRNSALTDDLTELTTGLERLSCRASVVGAQQPVREPGYLEHLAGCPRVVPFATQLAGNGTGSCLRGPVVTALLAGDPGRAAATWIPWTTGYRLPASCTRTLTRHSAPRESPSPSPSATCT